MPESLHSCAVLTGDLVASSRLSGKDLQKIRKLLVNGVRDVAKWEKDLVHREPEFFQGDSWQLLLGQPSFALRVSLFLSALLRARGPIRSRISIGLGSAEELSARGLGSSTGEAFTLSGRGLETMKNREYLSLQVSARIGLLSQWLPLAAVFCDALAGNFTRRQAEVLSHALHPDGLTHEQIRARLEPKVARQTVTKSLQSLHWPVLREVLETFEASPWSELLGTNVDPHKQL